MAKDNERLIRELKQAEQALSRLDGTLTTVEFDPNEPASIQAAVNRMEAAVDGAVTGYQRNPFVVPLVKQAKEQLAEKIRERASSMRDGAESPKEHSSMDNIIFRQLENTVNDLKWADRNSFPRHIKKLSNLLKSDDLRGINDELLAIVDLDDWLEKGKASQSGKLGGATLEWPTDTQKELGIVIALIHKFADNPNEALTFSHTFFYSGGKITPELQAMAAQVIVPFGRDFINFVKDRTGEIEPIAVRRREESASRKIFVVHGHDEAAKQMMARFLEGLDFEPIVLHEQASQGMTIIETIEAHSDVAFAVILLTPDDEGGPIQGPSQPRARQNVILELGYFIARLGRSRVAAFKKGEVEVPSDFLGVVYQEFDGSGAWKQALGRELMAAGFEIDWNKIMR